MCAQQLLPLRFGAVELAGKRRGSFNFRTVGLQQPVENPAHVVRVRPVRRFKFFQRGEPHQARQPFLGVPVRRNGVRLPVVLHLQPMLNLAQKAIRLGQQSRFLRR